MIDLALVTIKIASLGTRFFGKYCRMSAAGRDANDYINIRSRALNASLPHGFLCPYR